MKYFLTILYLLIFATTMQSQSVRASVESSEVYLGQPFEYKIIIEGTTNAQVPELKSIDGMNIQYKGASTSMVSSFGSGANSSTKTVTYSWMFTAYKKGSLIIPSFDVEVEGKVYKTASGNILVKEPEPIEGFYLLLNTEKDEYWLGEPVNLTIKWLFSSSVSNPSFNLPFIHSQNFTVERQDPPAENDVFKLNINGLDILAMQSAEMYKGEQYSTLSFELKLIPEVSGPATLGPITLAFDSTERSTGFRTTYKSAVIPSNDLALNIKPLPEEAYSNGKPIILSSEILELSATANPKKVHIGDPLTYTITVKGAVTPDAVEIPSLAVYRYMSDNFSIPDKRSIGIINEENVSFAQTIRAKNSSVDQIPSLDFKYFNMQSGRVETAGTNTVPIEVLVTEVVTSADLERTGYTINENSNKNDLVSNDQGLLYNFSMDKLITKNKNDSLSVMSNPIYWIILFLPIIIFIGFVLFKNIHLIISLYDSLFVKNSDFTSVYSTIKKSKSFRENVIRNEIYKYLSEFCQSNEKSLTADELKILLMDHQVEKKLVGKIYDLIVSFDLAKYSREKKNLQWELVLEEFYGLTKEMNR